MKPTGQFSLRSPDIDIGQPIYQIPTGPKTDVLNIGKRSRFTPLPVLFCLLAVVSTAHRSPLAMGAACRRRLGQEVRPTVIFPSNGHNGHPYHRYFPGVFRCRKLHAMRDGIPHSTVIALGLSLVTTTKKWQIQNLMDDFFTERNLPIDRKFLAI